MDQFRGLFVKLDQNQDGFISVSELHNEMRNHGILSADGKVQVIFIIIIIIIIILTALTPFIHSFIHHKPANWRGFSFS